MNEKILTYEEYTATVFRKMVYMMTVYKYRMAHKRFENAEIGICMYLVSVANTYKNRFGHKWKDMTTRDILMQFPEFVNKKPEEADFDNYWWEKGDYEIRLQKMYEIIDEVCEKINQYEGEHGITGKELSHC